MIGKISSGGSFGGCMGYITREKQDKQLWGIKRSV